MKAGALKFIVSYFSYVACYNAALAIDPLHATAHVNRGAALRQLGSPLAEERACYDSALAIDPLYAGAHCNRGGILHHLGAAQEEALARNCAC